MEKIKEEVPEKLRIAVLLSFISGYISAFTYNNAREGSLAFFCVNKKILLKKYAIM